MNTRRRIVALLVSTAVAALTWSGSVAAQEQSGLGANWPSAADASRSVNFHAYRWLRNGISYVQVNDRNGAPLVALAAAGGTIVVLPIGSAQVKVVQPSPSVAGAPVYTDERVSISSDDAGFTVQSLEAQPCSDPIECAKINSAAPVAKPAATLRAMSAQDTCSDPIECAK